MNSKPGIGDKVLGLSRIIIIFNQKIDSFEYFSWFIIKRNDKVGGVAYGS